MCGFSCICSEEISLKMQCDGGTNWLNNTWCAICLIKRNTFYSNVCSTAIKLARSRKCTRFDYIIDWGIEKRITKYIARFNLSNRIRRIFQSRWTIVCIFFLGLITHCYMVQGVAISKIIITLECCRRTSCE